MGVKGLQNFLKKYSVSRSLNDLLDRKNQKLRIGIDISFYIYRWQADVEKIIDFLRKLEENKHRIILVFDGRAEEGKIWETQRRKEARENEMKSADSIYELLRTEEDITDDQRFLMEQLASQHQKKGWNLTKDVRRSLKERLYVEKIPMVKAKGEADGLLAAMSARGDLDLIISGDMDLLAMGTKTLWTPHEDGLTFSEYDRAKILEELKLGDWQFRSLCAMCFTETCQQQNNFSIQQAYQMLKVFRSLSVLKQKYPEWLTVWPDDLHIFYRSVDQVDSWICDDQRHYYTAFMNCEPMPYT
jgi:hypothetical protein